MFISTLIGIGLRKATSLCVQSLGLLGRFTGLYTTVDRSKPLPSLPIELFDDIFYFLDTPSRLRLMQACRATQQRFSKSTAWRVVDFSPVVSVRQLEGIERFLLYTLTDAARVSVRELVLDSDWVFKEWKEGGTINIQAFAGTIHAALTWFPNLELFSIRGYPFKEVNYILSLLHTHHTLPPNLRRLNCFPSMPSYLGYFQNILFGRLNQITTDIRSCTSCNTFLVLRCDGCDQFLPACWFCLVRQSAWFFCQRCRYRGYCKTCRKMPVTHAIGVCVCGTNARPVEVCRPCDKDIARGRKVEVQVDRCSSCSRYRFLRYRIVRGGLLPRMVQRIISGLERAFVWFIAVAMLCGVGMYVALVVGTFFMWPLLLVFWALYTLSATLGLAMVIGMLTKALNRLNSVGRQG